MDADKRREQRRRAAQERVSQRRERGGDDAVAAATEEARRRQEPASTMRSAEASPRPKRPPRRPAADTQATYRLSEDAMAQLQEERDEAMAAGARQRAAIQGLVPFDAEEFEERLRSHELDRLDHCAFGHCRKRPKWMAPARAEDSPRFTRGFCHEHVTPPE